MVKSDSKDIYNVAQKKILEKMYYGFCKNSIVIFNIDNIFLEHHISILEWFLKDHATEDWSNDDENTALHHRNTLHLKI